MASPIGTPLDCNISSSSSFCSVSSTPFSTCVDSMLLNGICSSRFMLFIISSAVYASRLPLRCSIIIDSSTEVMSGFLSHSSSGNTIYIIEISVKSVVVMGVYCVILFSSAENIHVKTASDRIMQQTLC